MIRHTHGKSWLKKLKQRLDLVFFSGLCLAFCVSCREGGKPGDDHGVADAYADTAFWQEYHEAWPISNGEADVRRITVDTENNVWIATRSGVYVKADGSRNWKAVFAGAEAGPSFDLLVDSAGSVWMSTWNGVYRYRENAAEKMPGPPPPVSRLCLSPEGVHTFGPRGVGVFKTSGWQPSDEKLARSIRDAAPGNNGGIWIGTDVGLYSVQKNGTKHWIAKEDIASAYIRGVAFDDAGNLWAGGLGGVTVLANGEKIREYTTADGIPSVNVNTVDRGPDGTMWIGTDKGLVRFHSDSTRTLRFSRRWLMDDKVNDVAFDRQDNAWVATASGVSALRKKRMTLEGKALYFHDVLMRRHIRDPWIAGQCKLPVAGDTTVWLPDDDDNDGEYTGNYLAMESFRFAATRDEQARENAHKAFGFLKFLQEVTGTSGFFARTVVPADWKEVDDGNRRYSEKEVADELVKEPRFKPVEVRWHRSADGKWLWKGDTSSDEMCGHMMGYFFYYELAADESGKEAVRHQVRKIVDSLIDNDYNFIDVDGTHTRWGVWSPTSLNRDPEWMPDRSLNSMELLSFVKLAAYVTGEEKYEQAYRSLIRDHGYLDNMARIPNQNPGWFIYFDVMLAAYQYPILLRCEKDPELLEFYEKHIDTWFARYKNDKNPLINFIYCYSRNRRSEIESSVEFFKDTPLDLVDWPIDHTKREDVKLSRAPVLDEVQVDALPPASVRGTIRWDKNPYSAVSGNPHVEREPVFWLLPYWMGRYLGMIDPPVKK